MLAVDWEEVRERTWFDGRATCERLNPLLNDARQPASFAEWYPDWLAREEPLTTAEERRAARRSWHAKTEKMDKPIWFRWFD
jgi:hypothetical protein